MWQKNGKGSGRKGSGTGSERVRIRTSPLVGVAYFSHGSHGPVRCGPASKFDLRPNNHFHKLLKQRVSRLLVNNENYLDMLFLQDN